MSIFNKQWNVAKPAPADFLEEEGFSDVTKQLFWNRGLKKKDEIEKFLNPNYDKDLHDPYLLKDIKKAAERILKAIKLNESILIYGDYDADGVCAATLLNDALQQLGAKNIKVYIPDRHDEGYGINMAAVERFAKEGVNLIITVDCGSGNVAEVEFAQKKDIDVVITDHHQVLNGHDFAFALINPQRKDDKYPFKGLSGTGVAFKLAQVLFAEARKGGNLIQEGKEKWLLDLVAVATVTDVMPLLGENRILVKYGMLVLQKTRRPGLRALIKKSRTDVQKTDANKLLGFILGPRLNAAGRMHHANLAFDLLNTKDAQIANTLAEQLEQLNTERKESVSAILRDLEKKDFAREYAIVDGHESWPIGVLGIAAGRLADKYHKPVFLYQKKQYTLVGSARTPQNFNTVTILAEAGAYLQKFGGHAQAGGFTAELRHETNFAKAISTSVQKYAEAIGADKLRPALSIDAKIVPKDITQNLYKNIQKLSPFGEANPNPVFVLRNAYIKNPQMVGSQNNHFRCYVTDGPDNQQRIKAVGFGFKAAETFKEGDRADIVFNLDMDEWNGNSELVLKLLDVAIN